MLYWQMWPHSKLALLGAKPYAGVRSRVRRQALLLYKACGAYIILPQLKCCWSSIFLQATLCNNCIVVTQHIVTIIQHLICRSICRYSRVCLLYVYSCHSCHIWWLVLTSSLLRSDPRLRAVDHISFFSKPSYVTTIQLKLIILHINNVL